MQRVGEHSLPRGPLAPRWLAWSLDSPRAGVLGHARVMLENAGTATWRSRGTDGVQVAYHWLDPLGNPIVWDGIRTALPHPVAPGETVELDLPVLAPRPPGRYRLAFDLIEEHRFWFAEIGCEPLETPTEVAPRIAERRLRVLVHGGPDTETTEALAAQDEPVFDEGPVATAHLVAGCVPAPDWSRRLLNAHAEGWGAVGGAIDAGGRPGRLAPWQPGGGRNPRFGHPLLLPSLLEGLEPSEHEGLPAYEDGDALFEGRAVVRLPRRSGRRRA
ncbi:MAG: hypothetical protein ACXWZP_09465 [Gaiellaceae bacterium]